MDEQGKSLENCVGYIDCTKSVMCKPGEDTKTCIGALNLGTSDLFSSSINSNDIQLVDVLRLQPRGRVSTRCDSLPKKQAVQDTTTGCHI